MALYQHPGSTRSSMYWPVHVWKERRALRPGQELREVTRSKALRNVGAALKQHMNHLLKLGVADQTTQYFSSWRDTEESRDPCSHHMMHSKDITQGERSTALRYRTGTMYTAKQRHRFKQADSPRCMLCGQEDGGHHTASGCPALTRLYMSRHNKAGRAIARAIADGRHGAHLVMTDVGNHADGGQDEEGKEKSEEGKSCQEAPVVDLASLPHRIPLEALPDNMPHSVKQAAIKHSVPDAFLYCPAKQNGAGDTYMIAEIKYCRDTDPTQQLHRAKAQHTQLVDALKKAIGPKDRVKVVPVLLGVSGGIFTRQTLNTLKKLGVEDGALNRLKYKLHRMSVKHLHWIHTTKRKKERAMQPSAAGCSDSRKRTTPQGGWAMRDATCLSKRRRR